MSIQELMETETEREYLIPDVLPHPSVVLIYGAGGDGKSMSAWALAKHIATGKAFRRPWKSRSSEKGSCCSAEWRSASCSAQGTAARGGLPHHQRQHDPDGLAASALCPVHQADEEASAQAGGHRLADWLLWWSSL